MARRLFPAVLLLDANGNPAPNAPFKVYSDLTAGVEITDLRAIDGVTPLAKNGAFFLAGADSNTPHTRGPDTGTGSAETVALYIDSGASVRYAWVAVDATVEAILGVRQVLTYIAANPSGPTSTGTTSSGGGGNAYVIHGATGPRQNELTGQGIPPGATVIWIADTKPPAMVDGVDLWFNQ